MRKENERIKGELKLFRYYFLHLWKDKYRRDIQAPENNDFRHALIQNTSKLFDSVEAHGLILEDFGSKTYYLTFNSEENLQQFQAASAPSENMMSMMGTPAGPTPGMTPGLTPMGASLVERRKEKQVNEGMENLMTRISEYTTMVQTGEINDNQGIISGDRNVLPNQELEIFISGGGQCSHQYKYKKACLDFAKMQGSADGAIMLRVNCPVSDGQTYTMQIPKRLSVN